MQQFKYCTIIVLWYLLSANTTFAYTRQDTLRGSNGSGRSWWDVQKYGLNFKLDTTDKSIKGIAYIRLKITGIPNDSIQIDLQQPLVIDSVTCANKKIAFAREGNVYWLKGEFSTWDVNKQQGFYVYYHGTPRIAKLPPWDGGLIWTKDSLGNPWIAVACQGLGASSWWPCKDYQGDEPDSGMVIRCVAKFATMAISNGKMDKVERDDKTFAWTWSVKNPINSYDATFYMGGYNSWTDTIAGEKGTLNITFAALTYNKEKALKHFAVAKQMLHCFEYWMGPYPFYEDGYKLVEAPYLGMEHQSAVAYGNEYKMGYRGSDRSGTGAGLLFDFIIVHESGHEWFGNNITAKDIADNWLHEGLTTYTEALFVECAFGREKAFEYTRGEWKNIRNDKPVIGDYGVQDDGSSDKYDKGSAVVHMIRVLTNDDNKFRQLLRGLNKDFYHQTVTTAEIENYIIKFTGLDLKPLFQQYLRTVKIPELEYYIKKKKLYYHFNNIVEGFSLPLTISGRREAQLKPTSEWQSINWKRGGYNLRCSNDFLFTIK